MMESPKIFYRCFKCRAEFCDDEADTRDDGTYEEYWGRNVWVTAAVPICQWCGSDDLEETADPDDLEEDELTEIKGL